MRSAATRHVTAPDSEGCARSIGSESLCTRFPHGSPLHARLAQERRPVRRVRSGQRHLCRSRNSRSVRSRSMGWLAYHKSTKGRSMRKQIVGHQSRKPSPADTSWLHLEELAQVEITSEDSAHPVESALTPGNGSGWRAAEPGEQMLRLLFDKPLSLRHLRLMFREEEAERTQEFLLRWSSDGGTSYREIVTPAIQLQSDGKNQPGRGLLRRAGWSHCARAEHCSRYQRRECTRFAGTVAACMSRRDFSS